MSIGQLGMKHPSLAGMVTAIEARISRVALHYRFSAAAAAFLLKCLDFVLQQKFSRISQIDTKLLRPFRRVLIADSSSWDVSEKLRSVLPGSGGAASAANCKLQIVYDYKCGELGFLDVTGGTVPDNRYTDHLPGICAPYRPASSTIADLSFSEIMPILHQNIRVLSRFRLICCLVSAKRRTNLDTTPTPGVA